MSKKKYTWRSSWKLCNLPFIFYCYLWNNNLMLRQAVLILVWDVLLPRKKNVEHAQITWWIFSIFWAKGITTHLHHSITKTKAISLLYSKIGMWCGCISVTKIADYTFSINKDTKKCATIKTTKFAKFYTSVILIRIYY